MRKLFFCLLVLHSISMFPQQIQAQPAPVRGQSQRPATDSTIKIYVGGGMGLEYFSGILGVVAGYKVTDNLLLKAGAGIGLWGRKFSGGIRYDFNTAGNSWCLGLSYSSSSGNPNFNSSLQVVDSGKVVTRQVHLALLRASTVNFTISHKWVFRKKNEFCLEGGYCLPIETEPFRVLDGSVLTPASKTALRVLQPGGVHLSLGISLLFGLQ